MIEQVQYLLKRRKGVVRDAFVLPGDVSQKCSPGLLVIS